MRDMLKQKVSVDHLKRKAYLYVRQSSLRQLVDNQESTKRQYAPTPNLRPRNWIS